MDDSPIPDVMNRLRQAYPRITHLDWDNARTRHNTDLSMTADVQKHTPHSLFADFFERMTGDNMSAEQTDYITALIREIWEEKA
jgi:hypothetical protein